MPAETTAAVAALLKFVTAFVLGALGALVMAAVDPPKDRKALFLHAFVAGVGAAVFGPVAVSVVTGWYPALAGDLTLTIPVLFLVGALSWGAFGALARFRKILAERGASAAAGRLGLDAQRKDP